VLAVATALLEAGAVISALSMECRQAAGRRDGAFSAEYACVMLSTCHLVCAVVMLVVWSSVQDELRAQDLTSGTSKIHFGCVAGVGGCVRVRVRVRLSDRLHACKCRGGILNTDGHDTHTHTHTASPGGSSSPRPPRRC